MKQGDFSSLEGQVMFCFALSLALTQESQLPLDFLRASDFLLTCGMADPRGGELHRVTVKGSNEHRTTTTETIGWVLPDRKLAVCTNGLAYEVISVGDRVSVDLWATKPDEGDFPWLDFLLASGGEPPPNLTGMISAALLHRVGETALASSLLSRVAQPERIGENLTLSFLRAVQTRSMNAYRRGDFNGALAHSESFAQHRTKIEFFLESVSPPNSRPQQKPLDQFATLFAVREESARKLKVSPRPSLHPVDMKNLSVEEQVERLIQALDEVEIFEGGASNSVSYSWDAVWTALMDIGDPAIEPLLKVVRSDRRLSMVVNTSPSPAGQYEVVPVWKIAAGAIRRLMLATELPFPYTREIAVSTLPKHWAANKHLTEEQRILHILRDEGANPHRWYLAANWLVERREDGIARGDRLRLSKGNEINNLFLKRAIDVEGRPTKRGVSQLSNLQQASSLVDRALYFDAEGSAALQRWFCERTRERFNLDVSKEVWIDSILRVFGRATIQRLRVGDQGAASDYLAVMRRVAGDAKLIHKEDIFLPLTEGEHPDLRAYAETAFAMGEQWDLRGKVDRINGTLFGRRMLLMPSLLDYTIASLGDGSAIGEGRFDGTTLLYKMNADERSRSVVPGYGPGPPVEHITYRMRDIFGTTVASFAIPGAPKYDMAWSDERRQIACEELAVYLTANRAQLRELLDQKPAIP